MAKLSIIVRMPFTREVKILGPPRNTRTEAIKDGIELGKRYVVEGEAGAKTVSLRLKKRRWTALDLKGVDEKQLSEFVLPGLQGNQTFEPVQQRLLPVGEGWVRFSDDMLVHQQSQVFFQQAGEGAGQYFTRGKDGSWETAEPAHAPEDHPIQLRTASASSVRRGAKLDRAVLLNDITKIARLACKIPLSFVDRPACACAIFQGIRSAEAAQWCAENAHKKLLPRLANKVHLHDSAELEEILRGTLEELDAELLSSAFAFSGCSALLALQLGDRLVVAGVGQVRVSVLPEVGKPIALLRATGGLSDTAERERLLKAHALIRDGRLYRHREDLEDAERILCARHVFDVLGLEADADLDEKNIRTAYRKLALRVHPDKQAEGADAEMFASAFARLDSAKEKLEGMVAEGADLCRQMCRILRSDVHTRAGAADLLDVDKAASIDTEVVVQEAEKACKALISKLGKLQQVAPDYQQAVAICEEAVETLRRGCTPEALLRHEALLGDPVDTGRAMGIRDLRRPLPVVRMEITTASWPIPVGRRFRVALLCGATAALDDETLVAATSRHERQPKASALCWCARALQAGDAAACSTAICMTLGPTKEEAQDGPQVKKPRSAGSPDGTVRVRHILFRHQQLRQGDMMARRDGAARTPQEAEEAALQALAQLLQAPSQFPRLCRELSDCQSATQAGVLSGDLGWVAKGQQEPLLDDVIFALAANEFSDIVSSNRGVHIIQRLA